MLGLTLREEFRGRRKKGTAIELVNEANSGATQIAAADFLRITYPTTDVRIALEAVGPGRDRPVVLLGDRGQGKSHLLAVLHHALTAPEATRAWLGEWSRQLGEPKIASVALRQPTFVITESLSRQNYKALWDLLFERHPHGPYIRGKWEAQGDKRTDVPGDKLLIELFEHTPTALILDEFQTWYDGLTNSSKGRWKAWAFNFIQILSEIAGRHPDKFLLVVSVREGDSDAYQQLHRVGPVRVDFKGPDARRDRLRLLHHRLFENRPHVRAEAITEAIAVHVREYLRLMDIAPADHEKVRREFVESWPFAPHLMTLLEDQVLIATQAQETRDLIQILADLYRVQGDDVPLLTAADFRLDDDRSGIAALLNSVASAHHARLRERAQNNIQAVLGAVRRPDEEIPHLSAVVGALWLRSLALKNAGAERAELQVDITRERPIDDNAFEAEIATIEENSFNIHREGGRYLFREEENPQARLMASARNDRLFADGRDKRRLLELARHVLTSTDSADNQFSRIIMLPDRWEDEPWSSLLDPKDHPDQWTDLIPLLVLPDLPDPLEPHLGHFLRNHLQKRRNSVRFLLPREGTASLFRDRDLLVLARAVLLADEWRVTQPAFRDLHTENLRKIKAALNKRFDRFAILTSWNYQQPELCRFHIEGHRAEGVKIAPAIDSTIANNLFIREHFAELVLLAAQQGDTLAKLLAELQEPRPGGEPCIPWLGPTRTIDHVYELCARGEIAINRRGLDLLQRLPGEDEAVAKRRIFQGLPKDRERQIQETVLSIPQAAPQTADVSPTLDVKPTGPATQLPLDGGSTTGRQDQQDRPVIFDIGCGGGGSIFAPSPPTTRNPHSSHPTSPLNLLGKIESWGITPGSRVHQLALKVDNLTGAQLQKILRDLPEGLVFELSLETEES